MNLNPIKFDVDDDELQLIADIEIDECPICEAPFNLSGGRWMFGERIAETKGDWTDTVAFGCGQCESMGPSSDNRVGAIHGWNVLVGSYTALRNIYTEYYK